MTNKHHPRARRSFIFTPGLRPDMFPKAIASGADMVCVELEDGIAPHDKAEARQLAMGIFAQHEVPQHVEAILRINSLREIFGLDDVRAILDTQTPPPAIMLPKVQSPEEVAILERWLDERGHPTRIHVIIETNMGLQAVDEIAQSSSRLEALFFGGVDMAAELGCDLAFGPLLYARSRVVHAAATAGLDVIDVPFLDLQDPEGMREAAISARELGFSGKGAIHPKQIPILNEVYTPTAERVAHARRIIDAFESANTGLVVVDGKLIEKPVLREMHRILAIADRVGL